MTTATIERMLPLYEAKMIHLFDPRWVTYEVGGSSRDVTVEEKRDKTFTPLPRYWVREELVQDCLEGRWDHPSLLGWRDVCRSTDVRTMITSQFPTTAVGHTMPIALTTKQLSLLQAVWSSFVFDYVARQKIGGTHMTYGYLQQLAMLAPDYTTPWTGGNNTWFVARVDYLQSSDSWSGASRELVRAELDAAMFFLFGVNRHDLDFIMDSFWIVKGADEAEHGEYRTKRLILEAFDAMQEAMDTGTEYHSDVEQFLKEGSTR